MTDFDRASPESGGRIEYDSLGPVVVPAGARWGPQTERARLDFAVGDAGEGTPLLLVYALAQIKLAAAKMNVRLGSLDSERGEAIAASAGEVAAGDWDDQFPLSVWQSGSGTQMNMNVNEVIAHRANERLRRGPETWCFVHPNDHVNLAQSSNDVVPAALHLATLRALTLYLRPEVGLLVESLERGSDRWRNVVKIGRTHLQDATPMTVGQEWSGHAAMVRDCMEWIEQSTVGLMRLPLGATAVGTGLNAPEGFGDGTVEMLAGMTGWPLVPSPNRFASLATLDDLVRCSGAVASLAGTLFKLANDVRWLGSGPRAGLGELVLPSNEPGSSMMPGKVNPSRCESLMMVAVQALGNDMAVRFAGSQGNLQLNNFRPLVGSNLLRSIRLLGDASHGFRVHLIDGVELDEPRLAAHVSSSLMLVTALVPAIGYDAAARIVGRAVSENQSLREAALADGMAGDLFDRVVVPLAMTGSRSR